jgi:hypothetical protein
MFAEAAPPMLAARCKVASVNTLNYFSTLGRFQCTRADTEDLPVKTDVVTAIALDADIIGLQELEQRFRRRVCHRNLGRCTNTPRWPTFTLCRPDWHLAAKLAMLTPSRPV